MYTSTSTSAGSVDRDSDRGQERGGGGRGDHPPSNVTSVMRLVSCTEHDGGRPGRAGTPPPPRTVRRSARKEWRTDPATQRQNKGNATQTVVGVGWWPRRSPQRARWTGRYVRGSAESLRPRQRHTDGGWRVPSGAFGGRGWPLWEMLTKDSLSTRREPVLGLTRRSWCSTVSRGWRAVRSHSCPVM